MRYRSRSRVGDPVASHQPRHQQQNHEAPAEDEKALRGLVSSTTRDEKWRASNEHDPRSSGRVGTRSGWSDEGSALTHDGTCAAGPSPRARRKETCIAACLNTQDSPIEGGPPLLSPHSPKQLFALGVGAAGNRNGCEIHEDVRGAKSLYVLLRRSRQRFRTVRRQQHSRSGYTLPLHSKVAKSAVYCQEGVSHDQGPIPKSWTNGPNPGRILLQLRIFIGWHFLPLLSS